MDDSSEFDSSEFGDEFGDEIQDDSSEFDEDGFCYDDYEEWGYYDDDPYSSQAGL